MIFAQAKLSDSEEGIIASAGEVIRVKQSRRLTVWSNDGTMMNHS